jgi:hypothetical protein
MGIDLRKTGMCRLIRGLICCGHVSSLFDLCLDVNT